jgi:hypothetical protein
VAVTKHLADLRECRAAAQQLRCRGVPQPVRMDQAEPRPERGRPDHERDPARRQPVVRRADTHEHRPVQRARGSPIAQVVDDRFADVVRNGSRSERLPLPQTISSPARQSMS